MVKDIHDSATVGPSVTEGILPVYRWALQSLYGGADGVYRQWARLGREKKKNVAGNIGWYVVVLDVDFAEAPR